MHDRPDSPGRSADRPAGPSTPAPPSWLVGPSPDPADDRTLSESSLSPDVDWGARVDPEADTLPDPACAGGPTAGRELPKVPGYAVLGELGRGGMGVVYKAHEIRLNRLVALKMVLAAELAAPEAAVRFLAEAEAVARLQHPNVVQVFRIDEHGGRPYLEMELVDGDDLSARLDGTPRPPAEAAALIEPLARAIAEAHRMGIVHRDLKPANILIAPDGTPKVADFGLAKLIKGDAGLTQPETIIGSPSYMAPEQAAGDNRAVGPAADIYSLGAILYELLTGRPPFRGATVLQTLEQVKTLDVVFPSRLVPGLPRDLETICLVCLRKEPHRRFATAGALADDLRAFLEGRPIAVRRRGRAERAWRWCRRNRLAAGLMAAIVAILSVAAAASALAAGYYSRLAQERFESGLEAGRRAIEANAAVAFLVDLLGEATEAGGGEPPGLDRLLDRAEEDVGARFHNRPLVEASIRHALAEADAASGRAASGHEQARRAHALRRRHLGPEHAETLRSACLVARLARGRGTEAEAEARALLEQACRARRRAQGDGDPDAIAAMLALADLLDADPDPSAAAEARALRERAAAAAARPGRP